MPLEISCCTAVELHDLIQPPYVYVLVAVAFLSMLLWFIVQRSKRTKTNEIILEDTTIVKPIATPENKAFQYKSGLSKSRGFLNSVIQKITGTGVDEDVLEELEETLLLADVGAKTSFSIVERLRVHSKTDDLKGFLKEELMNILEEDVPLVIGEQRPYVMVMVGVNGSGKTTTIGKLAHRYIQEGHSVMVAAGDTFRAGAIEQLKAWADRVGAEFVSASPGADPGSVMFNALDSAKAKNIDILLCDTAGRLQAQQALMDELKKVIKVIEKKQPDAPHECLLVLDSTIGQNALAQADGFIKAAPLTGVVLTKLDGTAKGGVVLAVKNETNIPVRLVGLGEQPEDLHDFNRQMFIDAIFEDEEGEGQ